MNPRSLFVALSSAVIAGCGSPDPGEHHWSRLELVAGQLGGGAGARDGVGVAARLDHPQGVHADGAGNLYIADSASYTVRKLVLASGAVTTIAGSPGLYGTTNGVGADARFDYVSDVADDGAGNLYVADSTSIRKIELASGTVSRIAGSPYGRGTADGVGAAAQFSGPTGLACDGQGSLYVADGGAIRKIDLASASVTTLAGGVGGPSQDGTGRAARFEALWGIALDGAGHLFVSDRAASTVRQLDLTTLAVTTLVGSADQPGAVDGSGADARLSAPQGLASDGAGNLYVADTRNSCVRQIVVATAAVTTLAGSALVNGSDDGVGGAARLYLPGGLGFSAGSLFVADTYNVAIRQIVAATGATTTLAGAPSHYGSSDGPGSAARFDGPEGLASDALGNLYVADSRNQLIRKISAAGVVTTVAGSAALFGSSVDGVGTAARFARPTGLVADRQGNLFVSDFTGHVVRQLVLATGAVTTLAGSGISGADDGPARAASFASPWGLALDGAGNLYVCDSANHTVRKIAHDTHDVTTLAGSPQSAGVFDGRGAAAMLDYPVGIAYDGVGNLYVSDESSNTIRKIGTATGVVQTIFGRAYTPGSADGLRGAARFDAVTGLVSDGAGNLFAADTANGTVRRLDLTTQAVTTLVGVAGQSAVQPGPLPAALGRPMSLALTPTGELVVGDINENAILRVR